MPGSSCQSFTTAIFQTQINLSAVDEVTVTVCFFASYADSLGAPSMTMQLHKGSTVLDVITLVSALPGGSRLPPAPLVAVNLSYAPQTRVLVDGDEIALIPPVAGG